MVTHLLMGVNISMFLKSKTVFTLLQLLLCIIFFCISCSDMNNVNIYTTQVTIYKTYEMKPDDVRLRYLEHSLFSFEYPEKFQLIDLNHMPDHPMVYDVSNVDFTIEQTDLPWVSLRVRVQKPGLWDYHNANDVFEDWISTAESNGDTITSNKRSVSGIQAYYIETSGTREKDIISGTIIYQSRHESFRGVVFNYKELIWSITIRWDYFKTEPPEIDEYFNHVIETFNILD